MTSNLSKSNKAKFDANARNVIISFFDANERTEPKKAAKEESNIFTRFVEPLKSKRFFGKMINVRF